MNALKGFWRVVWPWLLVLTFLVVLWQFSWPMSLTLGVVALCVLIGMILHKAPKTREVNHHDHHEI